MQGIRFSAGPDGSSMARCVDRPRPQPGPGQLLVRVELAGVGIGTVRMLRADPAADPGGEMVGTVVAVGEDTDSEWLGRRIGGVVFESVYGDYVCAAPALVTAIPEGVGSAQALAVVRGGLVASGALHAAGSVAGKSVLITGAASGCGHLALQLARAAGAARVTAAVGSADKAGFVRDCGADDVVTYDEQWPPAVDVVLDGVGGKLVQRGVDRLAPYGVLVAFSAGGGAVDAATLLGECKTVTAFSVALPSRTRPELVRQWREHMWKLLREKALRPRVRIAERAGMDGVIAEIAARRTLGRMAITTR